MNHSLYFSDSLLAFITHFHTIFPLFNIHILLNYHNMSVLFNRWTIHGASVSIKVNYFFVLSSIVVSLLGIYHSCLTGLGVVNALFNYIFVQGFLGRIQLVRIVKFLLNVKSLFLWDSSVRPTNCWHVSRLNMLRIFWNFSITLFWALLLFNENIYVWVINLELLWNLVKLIRHI